MKTNKQLETPIAFIIFNRPDTTQRVFDEIKKSKPKQLFVIADGARNEEEKKLVEKTREIIKQVDWDCEVKTNYSDKNLGCKARVSSGIDWFFENVEQGIILEDDCLPSQSFFYFCDELLNKYKDDEKVMMISGDNFQFGKNKASYDYYFSKRHFHVWGWATWRKAWNKYDVEMKKWPEVKNSRILEKITTNQKEIFDRKNTFEKTYEGLINTWDYQWVFTCMLNEGLSIIPNKNLISNIGFDDRGTHTNDSKDNFSNMIKKELAYPLKHPNNITFNDTADEFTLARKGRKWSCLIKLLRKLRCTIINTKK